jgi:hypothetical protein
MLDPSSSDTSASKNAGATWLRQITMPGRIVKFIETVRAESKSILWGVILTAGKDAAKGLWAAVQDGHLADDG